METHGTKLASPLFVSEADMTEAASYEVAGGRVVIFSTRSPGKTTTNEDSAALLPLDDDSAVLIVADGVGGAASGEQASRLAIATIHRTLVEGRKEGADLRMMLMDGIERANAEVLGLGSGTATTFAAVEVTRNEIRTYHVGDSMIMVTGQRGRVKFETVSHSPVGYAVAAGILDVREAMHHVDRHLVSNVIGSSEMHIDVGPRLPLSQFDTVLIASDGLSDNLHQHEIVERIRKGPLTHAVNQLVGESHRRMDVGDGTTPSKPDDLTVILFRRGK